MVRRREQLARRRRLDHPAQIHDHHPVRDVLDHPQIVADEQVGQAELRAQAHEQVDHLGLDDIDRRILRTIVEKFNGGPVGLDTIGAAISEDRSTIMDVYEPYLLQLGFLDRTPRGRIATPHAYDHIGVPYVAKEDDPEQPSLF